MDSFLQIDLLSGQANKLLQYWVVVEETPTYSQVVLRFCKFQIHIELNSTHNQTSVLIWKALG